MSPNVDNLTVFPFYGPIYDWDLKKPDWNSRKYWAFGQAYPFVVPYGSLPTAQFIIDLGGPVKDVDTVSVYRASDDQLVWSATPSQQVYSIEDLGDNVFAFVLYSEDTVFQPLYGPGPYYIVVTAGDYSWYSDVFISVGLTGPDGNGGFVNPWTEQYLELSWYDEQNFLTDDNIEIFRLLAHPGQYTQFQNRVYLMTDIGMPDYSFEEEGEERDGYFFPFRQISKKIYRFKFMAPEYLCDSLRLVRMADHIVIRYDGHTYNVTNFTPTFEWQDGGLLAAVTVEFETNAVAKKIGWGKIPST